MYPTSTFDRADAVARVQHLIESKFARDGRIAPFGFVMWRDLSGEVHADVPSDLSLIPRLEDQREALRALCRQLEGVFAVFHAAECWMPKVPDDPAEERRVELLYLDGRLDEVPGCQDGVLLLSEARGDGVAVWSGLIERGESCTPRIARWHPTRVEGSFRSLLPEEGRRPN